MDPTDAETACFEAGIKFGSLYHQFAGTPVSPASADSLARAMEAAIENQPHCTDVTVSMDRSAIATAAGDHGYTELSGRFMDVEVRIERAGISVDSEMSMTDGYPLMRIVSVED